MKTWYFNTGVNTSVYPSLAKGEISRGGTKQIPFETEDIVPDNAQLICLCDNPALTTYHNAIVVPVFNTNMLSKYAYFKIPT